MAYRLVFSTIVLWIAASALALPAVSDSGDNTTNIKVPSQLCIYLCTDAGWTGYCEHVCTSPGLCSQSLQKGKMLGVADSALQLLLILP